MLTAEQTQAIATLDENLVVVAGAGSGKTYVLVERYIHLLETQDIPLSSVVAITFTRAAALEMRDRVRQQLEMKQRTATTPDDRARWASLLATMDTARIDTIHGLCATILRANAAEANVDPGFEVLEPVESEALLSDAIDSVFQSVVDEGEGRVAQLFTEYDRWQVRDVLSNAALMSALLDSLPDSAEELFEEWQDEWAATVLQTMERLQYDDDFTHAAAWVGDCKPPEGDKLTPIIKTVRSQLGMLFSDDTTAVISAAETIDGVIDLRGGAKSNWGSTELVEHAKAMLRVLRGKVQDVLGRVGEPLGECDYIAAEMTLRWDTLVRRVRETYTQMKAAEGKLDFDDLESRTAELLASHPRVRDRYCGTEFRHLLVDEFQDTNAAQWTLVQALADTEQAALFVVGDMKQSIYGFRGADVRVFGAVRDELRQLDNGTELTLSKSFRSRPELIDIFNTLFEATFVRDAHSPMRDYQIDFEPEIDAMTAHRDAMIEQSAPAPVELNLLCTKSELLDENISADERRLWEAHTIAGRLQQLHDDGALIHDKESDELRPFQYGDAAILFRATTNITTYEDALKANQIPFVTVGGRGYYNRQEVWDVLNLLKALHNPADNLSLAAALRSPLFGFSDDLLYALRLMTDDAGERLSLWDALHTLDTSLLSSEQHETVASAVGIVQTLRAIAGRVTISELLRRALSLTGYLAILTGLPNGARLRRNVEKLIDIAEDSGKITLGAFSHYLNDLTNREVREGEATLDATGAVQLMSIHASKGLEFPVVVLADVSRRQPNFYNGPAMVDDVNRRLVCRVYDDDERKLVDSYPYLRAKQLQSQKDDAESKRLLYVAATRARDMLILSGEVKKHKKGWGSYGWLDTILEAMDVWDYLDLDERDLTLDYAGQRVRVRLPVYDESEAIQWRGADTTVDWRELDMQTTASMPLRMQPLPATSDELLGHIAATQLVNIGGYLHSDDDDDRDFYWQKLRRSMFDEAPTQVTSAVPIRDSRVSSRQVGEVVHEALRYWRFPETVGADLDDILRGYAWQQGVTEPDDTREIIRRARELLTRFQQTTLYARLQAIRRSDQPFYSEMPFVLKTEKRIIHGVIDVLFQNANGDWTILDYKTSYIPQVMPADVHARRYHLQLGAYAAAVQRQLGITPDVRIHYIQYNETVKIPASVWQEEIYSLERYIGDVLGMTHDRTNRR